MTGSPFFGDECCLGARTDAQHLDRLGSDSGFRDALPMRVVTEDQFDPSLLGAIFASSMRPAFANSDAALTLFDAVYSATAKPIRSGNFSMYLRKMSLATGPAVEPPW